jgi:hypothetical protein
MSPDRTKLPGDNLTKELLAPDIDTLKRFFVQGLKTTVNGAPTPLTGPEAAIGGLPGAGLIATKNVVPENSTEWPELLPVSIASKGICCSAL